jgi:hypothetical protein
MIEHWKTIAGYEGRYEASDLGRIRSLPNLRRKTILIMRLQPNTRDGYFYVGLTSHDGIRWRQKLHAVAKLVTTAFYGPRPVGMEACHDNGDHQNNAAKNLRWDTPINNQADRIRHGTANIGSQNPSAKLNESDVRAIKIRLNAGEHPKNIAPDFSVGYTTIKSIKNGGNWGHIHV